MAATMFDASADEWEIPNAIIAEIRKYPCYFYIHTKDKMNIDQT